MNQIGIICGPTSLQTSGSAEAQAITNNTDRLGLSFLADWGASITSASIYCPSVASSPDGSLIAEIYAASGLEPTGSALATSDAVAAPTGAGWLTFTFSTPYTPADGALIFVAFGRAGSTTGTISLRFLNPQTKITVGSELFRKYTYTASAWGGALNGSGGALVTFSNGNVSGVPIEIWGADASAYIYFSNMAGNIFKSPIVPIVIRGVYATYIGLAGAPPVGHRALLIVNGVIAATSNVYGATQVAYTNVQYVFPRPITVPPGSVCRVVIATDNSSENNNSNRFVVNRAVFKPGTLSLFAPFNGSLKRTYFNGSTWTDTADTLANVYPILDISFAAPAPLNRRKYHNQR